MLPKPLPKWVGVLGTVVAIYSAIEQTGLFAVIPDAYRVYVAAFGAAIATFSHSLTGTGGK